MDIRLRRLPTSASAEVSVSSSLGAGSGRQTGARYRPVCNHSSRCGALAPPGDQASWRRTTLPSGACRPQPRTSGEGFRAVRPRGEPDRLTCTNGGAQRTVPWTASPEPACQPDLSHSQSRAAVGATQGIVMARLVESPLVSGCLERSAPDRGCRIRLQPPTCWPAGSARQRANRRTKRS